MCLQLLAAAVQCIYVMVEKMQAYTGGKFDLSVDVEQAFQAKVGDAPEQVENLTITKRIVSTSALCPCASLTSRPFPDQISLVQAT